VDPDQRGDSGPGGPHAEEVEGRAEAGGASVGEAKWSAMKELERRYPGLSVEQVAFEELDSGDEAERFRVSAVADLAAWRASEKEFDWPDEPTDRVRELLRRLAAHFGLRASVDLTEDEDELRANLSGSELGLLIGRHGQTIDALQYLCAQAAFRGKEDRKRVVVDAGGYRERRETALRRQADRGVADALRFGRPVELDSMGAQERKVVHVYLQDRADVETHSEGDEPYRRIVISPLRRRPQGD
jgi:spoIIIJ-associated protein